MTIKREELASRCHDIQVSLGNKEVPEFDALTEIGMTVRLAIHLRGLPLIKYEVLKLVAFHYLKIPGVILKNIISNLYEVGFVKVDSEGDTIKSILPTVPYFDDLYDGVGEFAEKSRTFNEPEQVALTMLTKYIPSYQKLII